MAALRKAIEHNKDGTTSETLRQDITTATVKQSNTFFVVCRTLRGQVTVICTDNRHRLPIVFDSARAGFVVGGGRTAVNTCWMNGLSGISHSERALPVTIFPRLRIQVLKTSYHDYASARTET